LQKITRKNLKILDFNEIKDFKYPSIITIGMFDGVHIGHQKLLNDLILKAKEINAKSVVISFKNHPRLVLEKNSNESPVELLQTNEERFAKIEKMGIDYLLLIEFSLDFSHFTPKQFLDILIDKLNPKILFLGYDNHFGNPNNTEFKEILEKGYYKTLKIEKDNKAIYHNGIEVSSTEIRKALQKGDISLANSMLNENYSICSKVISGKQIGRTMGFPTANISIPKNKLLPKDGVYAVKVEVEGKIYNGITNIGFRPTFNGKDKSIETHIFSFVKNIYNKEIKILFFDFLRVEKRFENPLLLKQQIQQDYEKANSILP
jgi:riboflavin kinase/FMN adenylyltransferase